MEEPRCHRPLIIGRRGAVAANHPLGAQGGLLTVREGGNAVDAAVATALALAVVEPMMSGLGGDGFYHVFDAPSGRAIVFNATGPALASRSRWGYCPFATCACGLPHFTAQLEKTARIACSSHPFFVREYSTLGGEPGKTLRWTMASRSSSVSLSVRLVALMPSVLLFSSLNLVGCSFPRLWMTGNVQILVNWFHVPWTTLHSSRTSWVICCVSLNSDLPI